MMLSALEQRQHKFFQRVSVYLLSGALALHPLGVYADDIVTNGKTATTVNRQGNVTSVTTETINGNSAFNAFSQFDVAADNTVNLYLPDGTGNLINLVYDKRSDIHGVLNSIKDGKIGGNVYFANPYGMIVGEQGSINVGSLSISTPTTSWMDNFFSHSFNPSPQAVQELINGNVPLSASGLVSIKGKINAQDNIEINAGRVSLNGSFTNGTNSLANRIGFSDVVNVEGVQPANAIKENNGVIEIYAANEVEISGLNTLNGNANLLIEADEQVSIREGAVVSSRNIADVNNSAAHASAASTGNSGNITIYAPNIDIEQNVQILAHATNSFTAGDVSISNLRPIDVAAIDPTLFEIGGFSLSDILGEGNDLQGLIDTLGLDEQDVSRLLNTDSSVNINVGGVGGAQTLITGNNVEVHAYASDRFGFNKNASANVNINNTRIDASSLNVFAESDTDLYPDLFDNTTDVGPFTVDPNLFVDNYMDSLGIPDSAFYVSTTSSANTQINGAQTDFNISGNLQVDALARNAANPFSTGLIVGMEIVDATTMANVSVDDQANLQAGQLALSATAESKTTAESDVAGVALPLAFSLALTNLDSSANVSTGSDTVLNADSIAVNAKSETQVSTSALAEKHGGNSLVTALAISDVKSSATATADGSLTSDELEVTALTESISNKTSATGGATGKPGVGDKFNNLQQASKGLLLSKALGKLTTKNDKIADLAFPQMKSGSVNIAGAIAIAETDNTAHASLGANTNATVTNATNIDAQIKDSVNIHSDVKSTSTGVALGGAMSIADYNNSADAWLDDGAQITTQALDVNAESRVPYPWDFDYTSLTTLYNKLTGGWESLVFTSSAFNTNKADGAGASASINSISYNNNATAHVDDGAQITITNGGTGAVNITAHTETNLVTVSGKNPLSKNASGLGGSVNVINTGGTTQAYIADNAIVNTDLPGTNLDLTVAADAAINTISVAESGGSSQKIGVEGAVSYLEVDQTTSSYIAQNADVNANSVALSSDTDVALWNIAGGFVRSEAAGVGFSVAINDVAVESKSIIGDETATTQGAQNTVEADTVAVDARADGVMDAISIAGALVSNSDQKSDNIFSKFSDAKKKAGDTLDSLTASVNSMRDSSSNSGSSGSGSGSSGSTEPTPKPNFGIGISGSASVNDVAFDTKASIENARVDAGEIALNAINSVNIDAGSGSASFVKAKSANAKNTAALAGAFASNDIQNSTEALVKNANLVSAESVDVVALSGGEQLSVALGMAVNASGNSGNSASVAGSVSMSKNASSTAATVIDSTITGDNSADSNVDVVAYDKSQLGVGGGSLFYGGRGGIGAAVSLSEINNTISSTVNNSALSQFNDISVRSLNAAKIATGAAMAGGGSGTNSLAGSFVFSEIGNTTSVNVNNNSVINAADQIDILASDIASDNILDAILSSGAIGSASEVDYNGTEVAAADAGGNSIVAVAGLVQVGKNNIGVSVVSGEISNTVATNVDSATLNAGSSLDVHSVSNAAITEVAIGVGGGTGSLAANGSVVISDIGNNISATTNNSNLTANNLTIKAEDKSTIDSLAGNIAASAKVAIGASVTSSTIHNSVTTNMSGGTLNVSDSVTIDSATDSNIQNLAAAGGAAGKVAVGVSIAINDIRNNSTAGVSNVSVNQALNSLDVNATDSSHIQSLAGSVNGAGTAAAGAAIAVNTSESAVEAFVNDIAGMNVANFFDVNADTTGTIESIAISGGGAGTTAFGGSSTSNFIENTTHASVLNVAANGATADINVTADDASTIKSLAGNVQGSGTASVGAAVAVNEIDNQTGADISGATTNLQVGNVAVDATGDSQIQTLAAGVAVAGQVGVAGSVAVNLLGNDVDAHINDDATVIADGNIAVRANSSDDIDVLAGAVGVGIGAVGVGASVSVNDIQSTTKAYIEGANTTVVAQANNSTGASTSDGIQEFAFGDSIASLAAAAENGEDGSGSTDASYSKLDLENQLNTSTTRGVVVNARSAQNVDAAGVTTGVGTYVGVGATANVNILGGTTEAYIDQANINSQAGANAAQQLAVVAEDHSYTNSFVGALGGGAVGLGAAADTSVLQRATSANIRGNGDINAANAVTVKADASQGANSIAVGAAGGGTALAASGSVLKFDANTEAYIDNTDVDAGSLLIQALAENQISFFDFTAAIAGFGAVAGAYGVSISDNTTRAYLNGTSADKSVITSDGDVQVLANSATEVDGKVISFAADSGAAGVAGMAAVNIITNTTEASANHAQVGSATGDVNSLKIAAHDEITLDGFSGAAGVSGNAGIGAGASVNIVKSRVIADLNNSTVFAANAVEVEAQSEKAASGITATAGAGLTVGIGGAAAVNLFGSEVKDESASELDNNGAGTLSSVNNFTTGDKTELLEGQSDKTLSETELARLQSSSQTDVKTVSTSSAGQAQYRTGATISGNSVINANSVTVSANDNTSVSSTVGGVGVGAVGIGGAFSLTEIKNNINAEVGSSAQLNANNVAVNASADKLGGSDDVVDSTVFAGGAGIVGIGAAVGMANIENNVNAQLGGNINAAAININAQDNSSAKLDAVGAAVGAAAVGVVIADSGKRTTVNASTADSTSINGANTVAINSASAGRVSSSTIAAAGGIISGTGADSTASDTSIVSAFIGDNNSITSPSANVQVLAQATPEVNAEAKGAVVAYGAAVGVSLSEATASTTVSAGVGDNTLVQAASLSVNALQNKPTNSHNAFADSLGVGGGLLVGINATKADAKNNSVITASVGGGSTVNTTGAVTISAESNAKHHSNVDAANGGIVALGANKANTATNTTVSSTIASTATVSVHNLATADSTLTVSAVGNEENTANSISGSGGVVSGVSSTASTTTNSLTTATIGGSSANLISSDALNLHAEHTATVNSSVNSINASIAGASGAYANNTVNSTVESNILANSFIETGFLTISAVNNVVKNWLGTQNGSDATANVKSGSGGVLDAPAAASTSTFNLDTNIHVGESAIVNASGDGAVSGEDDAITMDVLNSILARDKAELNSGGAISIARASSKMTANVNGAITIADNAIVSAERGDVGLGARMNVDMENRSSADTYGLAGAPEGDTYATLNGANNINVSDGALLMADHGELSLAAGRSSQGQRSNTRLHTKVNLWNKTAIPMSTDPDARSITNVDNNVNIEENANVLASSDISLAADQGNVTLYAYGLGKDIYRETAAAVASGISNAFGGGDVSFDITSSVETNNNASTVRVDGSVETSIHREQFLSIDYIVDDDLGNYQSGTDEDGVSTLYVYAPASFNDTTRDTVIYEIKSSEGVSYGAVTTAEVGAKLRERIDALREMQGEYSQDSISYQAIQSEITFLERRLVALGYASDDNAGTLGANAQSLRQILEASRDSTQGVLDSTNTELTQVGNNLSAVDSAQATVAARAQAQTQLNTELAKDEDDQDAGLIASLQTQIAGYNTQLANDGLPETNTELVAIENDLLDQQTELNEQKTDLETSITQANEQIVLLDSNPIQGPIADFMTVDDIHIDLGNINIVADNLVGSGSIKAPGDASILIENYTPIHLTLQDLVIDSLGGFINFNEFNVSTVADINNINRSQTANFSEFVTAVDGHGSIDVESHYNVLSASRDYANEFPSIAPDLRFGVSDDDRASIWNPQGSFTVRSEAGSVYFDAADVFAGQVNMEAKNGDFVQSYTDTFYHVGGNPQAIQDGTQQVGSGIVANGDVFISARYLNINSLIQSGIEQWQVNIGNDASIVLSARLSDLGFSSLAELSAFNPNYTLDPNNSSVVLFNTAFADAIYARTPSANLFEIRPVGNDNIGASYDAATNQILLDGIEVSGGFIQLFGQIMNTSWSQAGSTVPGANAGRLRVLDGYGQVSINNDSSYELVVNTIGTGRGVEGIIDITDIVSVDSTGAAQTMHTRYSRVDGQVIVESDRSITEVNQNVYTPHHDMRYVWLQGQDYTNVERYHFTQDNLFGGIPISGTNLDQYRVSGPTPVGAARPLDEGRYLDERAGVSTAQHSSAFSDRYSTGTDTWTTIREWTECNWWTICIASKKHVLLQRSFGETEITKESVYAANPIAIEFIGNENGGSIDIDSSNNVRLAGSIFNESGHTSVNSLAGIFQTSDTGVLHTGTMGLNAVDDIRGNSVDANLRFIMSDELNATSSNGAVRLAQQSGDLTAGQISAATTVSLIAEGSIVAGTNSLISADRVELEAGDAIGSETQHINIASGYTDNFADADYGLRAVANDDIYLVNVASANNTDGHLLVDSVESRTGDVHIETSGDIIDNNTEEEIDSTAWNELLNYWNNVAVLGNSSDNAVLSDPAFIAMIDSGDAAALYASSEFQSLSNNGKKQVQTLLSEQQALTSGYQQYWQLRNQQSDPTVYDADFAFTVSAAERSTMEQQWTREGVATSEFDARIAEIENKRSSLYHQLHTEVGSLNNGVFDQSFVYVLSDEEKSALLNGASWSERELGLALSPGLLKEVTDTNPIIKTANIRGNNIVLQTNTGNIGNRETQIEVSANIDPATLTDAQRVALASAERADIEFEDDLIRVVRRRALNVDTSDVGGISASAVNGYVYLGSEQDIVINSVQAADEARIKVAGNIIGGTLASGQLAHINSGNLVLESADNFIGSDGNSILVAVNTDNALTARAQNDIYVQDVSGELALDTLFSRGQVVLNTDGNIVDAFADDFININAAGIQLNSGGNIGTDLDALDIEVGGNSLVDATADGFINLRNAFAPLAIGDLTSGSWIQLYSEASSSELHGSITSADSVTITSDSDFSMLDGSRINSETLFSAVLAGNLLMADNSLISSNGEIDIETGGSMTLGGLLSQSSSAEAITLNAGAQIIDGGDMFTDIAAPNGGVLLAANDGIGVTNPLEINAAIVDINAENGDVVINSENDLNLNATAQSGSVIATTGGTLTTTSGINAFRDVNLRAERAIDASSITAGQLVTLSAPDIRANIQQHADSSGPLRLSARDGYMRANSIDLQVAATDAVIFQYFWADNGFVNARTNSLTFEDALIRERATIFRGRDRLLVDNTSPRALASSQVQIYPNDQHFSLLMENRRADTDAVIVRARPAWFVNSPLGEDLTVFEYTGNLLQYLNGTDNMPLDGFANEQPQEQQEENVLELPASGNPEDVLQLQSGVSKKDEFAEQEVTSPELKVTSIH